MTHRLFFALCPPAPLQKTLAELPVGQVADRDWRFSPACQVHLTLVFLGQVDSSRIPQLVRACEAALAGQSSIGITLDGWGGFPDPERARYLVAYPSPSEALTGLQARLAQACEALGFTLEKRPFRPHLTLARRARGGGPLPIGRHDVNATFSGNEVILFHSERLPDGAIHRVEHRFSLG